MTLRERLLALIAQLKTMGPTVLLLLQFVETLLASTPARTLAKGAAECCDPCEYCWATEVHLVEALVSNAACKASCTAKE